MKLIKYIEGKSEIIAVSRKTHNNTITAMIQSIRLASPHVYYLFHDFYVPCARNVSEATMQGMFNLFMLVSQCPLDV